MIRFDTSPSSRVFVDELAKLDVKLPLKHSDEDAGVVLDAEGRGVITIDVNGERPDLEAVSIAVWIAMAVNTCGGFIAEIRHDS